MTRPDPQVATAELGIDAEEAAAIVNMIWGLPVGTTPLQVTIRQVALTTGIRAAVVKKTLLYLFLRHFLSGSFQPLHTRCGKVIGKSESSAEAIREKAGAEKYGAICPHCHEDLDGQVDTEILFWLRPTGGPDEP